MLLRQVQARPLQGHHLRALRRRGHAPEGAARAHGSHRPRRARLAHLVLQGRAEPHRLPARHRSQGAREGPLLRGVDRHSTRWSADDDRGRARGRPEARLSASSCRSAQGRGRGEGARLELARARQERSSSLADRGAAVASQRRDRRRATSPTAPRTTSTRTTSTGRACSTVGRGPGRRGARGRARPGQRPAHATSPAQSPARIPRRSASSWTLLAVREDRGSSPEGPAAVAAWADGRPRGPPRATSSRSARARAPPRATPARPSARVCRLPGRRRRRARRQEGRRPRRAHRRGARRGGDREGARPGRAASATGCSPTSSRRRPSSRRRSAASCATWPTTSACKGDGRIEQGRRRTIEQWALKVREVVPRLADPPQDAEEAHASEPHRQSLRRAFEEFKGIEPKRSSPTSGCSASSRTASAPSGASATTSDGGMGAEAIRELLPDARTSSLLEARPARGHPTSPRARSSSARSSA